MWEYSWKSVCIFGKAVGMYLGEERLHRGLVGKTISPPCAVGKIWEYFWKRKHLHRGNVGIFLFSCSAHWFSPAVQTHDDLPSARGLFLRDMILAFACSRKNQACFAKISCNHSTVTVIESIPIRNIQYLYCILQTQYKYSI